MDLIDLLFELKNYIKKRVNLEQIKDISQIVKEAAKEQGNLRIERGANFIQTKIKNRNFDWKLIERETDNMISVIENRVRL